MKNQITPAQIRHLENIKNPDPNFKNTCAGFYCRKLGLSEWLWEMTDGSKLTKSQVDKLPRPIPADRCVKSVSGEVLTEKGETALDQPQ